MALRTILTDEDPTLKKISRPVTNFDHRLHELIDDMRETLEHAHGAGLAAPQVGILRRVVLVANEDNEIYELVNPELVTTEGEVEDFEGCLSVPGYYGLVTRPEKATVRAQDRNGKEFVVSGEGIVARCFCHEIDHLNGHLFTEYTDKLYTPAELDEMLEEESEA